MQQNIPVSFFRKYNCSGVISLQGHFTVLSNKENQGTNHHILKTNQETDLSF
jgi:hypothetical protein